MLVDNEEITPTKLIEFQTKMSRLHNQRKIDKADIPMRPIVSSSSPHRMSKHFNTTSRNH